jgi:hypothetical protein
MKRIFWLPLLFVVYVLSVPAQPALSEAQQLERRGEALRARTVLERAARDSRDASAVLAYAEFLDRHDDPETRAWYGKVLALLDSPADRARRAAVARRLVLLDLAEGDRDDAAAHLKEYRAAGGRDWGPSIPEPPPARDLPATSIPGPIQSFERMAGLPPDTQPEELVASLARNIMINGYQATLNGEALEPTEYLKLINRYLSQARELQTLAGKAQEIRVDACESTRTADLLRILGYRMRGNCGGELSLETVNASRAFLTIDSGFPLAELEQALRTDHPFVYPYRPSRVPLLYGADYWLSDKDRQTAAGFIDAFMADPAMCRLYNALSKLDPVTAEELRKAVPMPRLKALAHVLDFYGAMFELRDGHAVVPGDARSAAAWASLAGASPDRGAAFFEKLVSKDDGWLASYFDALARASGPVKAYLTEPQRLVRFYTAVRGRTTSPGPARPVFRGNPDLLLLTARLRIDSGGRPHIPGGLEVWKQAFQSRDFRKVDSRVSREALAWKEPDDLLEALFILTRKSTDNLPLKAFMVLSDLDGWRAQPLEPEAVARLLADFAGYGSQYVLFTESPALRGATMIQYLNAAQAVRDIGDVGLRADSAGVMQALAGLWQILCRQGAIPQAGADAALWHVVTPFTTVREDYQLFDAGRAGIKVLLEAAGAPPGPHPQEQLLGLLAAPGGDAPDHITDNMLRILEAQRLASLDTLLGLGDALDRAEKGELPAPAVLNPLVAAISGIELPRPTISPTQRSASSYGYWLQRHIDDERKLNLKAEFEKTGADAGRLRGVRGSLAPWLRDTLVGFNYAYYAPPGAQLLLANPVFVRSHDFIGYTGADATWRQTTVAQGGWPTSAGGRLIGSLSALPYALADAEQNFMVPEREQALIWNDLVPQMILTATVPRWSRVSAIQIHWVGLHMRYAQALAAEAALDPERRSAFLAALAKLAVPARVHAAGDLLAHGEVRQALEEITPQEMFAIARDALESRPDAGNLFAAEIHSLASQSPALANYAAISHAFGTPKPVLTSSYHPELLFLRTFPTLMGYSSRVLAESWESNLLYWAAVADSVHIPPANLNVLIPKWTEQAVEKIFAGNLDDWPAVLRSLRKVGDDVRLKTRVRADASGASDLN